MKKGPFRLVRRSFPVWKREFWALHRKPGMVAAVDRPNGWPLP